MSFLNRSAKDENVVDFQAIEGEAELSRPEIYAGNILEWAIERHASDLFVSDAEASVIVSVRRMGRVEQVARLAKSYGRKLQGFLRVSANTDPADFIHPSEGRGALQTPNGTEVDLRLSSIPTLFGLDVAIRLFDSESGRRKIADLGMDSTEQETYQSLLEQRSGLILVSGPVASGKSSTLYAAIEHLNNGSQKIHTLEDPIEHSIDGVMQTQVSPKSGMDFADLLSVVLRHSPDVIMIGEIRDALTAATAVRAGASGQLVLATLHSKSAADAIDSMLQYGVPPKFLAGALTGVICQRLVRKLCSQCRQEVCIKEPLPINDRVRWRLGDMPGKVYVSEGCEACFGDGYESLVCLPEVMSVGHEISHCIERREPASVIHDAACNAGMLSLAEAATLRVVRGEMTTDDANRIAHDHMLSELSRLSRG